MPALPVTLRLENRPVVVIGGGAVALRHGRQFIECDAHVRVATDDPAVNQTAATEAEQTNAGDTPCAS